MVLGGETMRDMDNTTQPLALFGGCIAPGGILNRIILHFCPWFCPHPTKLKRELLNGCNEDHRCVGGRKWHVILNSSVQTQLKRLKLDLALD